MWSAVKWISNRSYLCENLNASLYKTWQWRANNEREWNAVWAVLTSLKLSWMETASVCSLKSFSSLLKVRLCSDIVQYKPINLTCCKQKNVFHYVKLFPCFCMQKGRIKTWRYDEHILWDSQLHCSWDFAWGRLWYGLFLLYGLLLGHGQLKNRLESCIFPFLWGNPLSIIHRDFFC